MSLHLSSGLGGDDLTVGGCVESKPGPDNRYPARLYEEGCSDHEKWQIKYCAVCLTSIPRKDWSQAKAKRRVLYLRDSSTVLAILQRNDFLPGYGLHLHDMPQSLHYKCLLIVAGDNSITENFRASLAKSRLRLYADNVAGSHGVSRHCSPGGVQCDRCVTASLKQSEHEKHFAPKVAGLSEFTRSPNRFSRRVVTVVLESKMESSDLVALQSDMRASTRSMARGADGLRKRRASGSSEISSVSGSVHRRDTSALNKCFARLFASVPCTFSLDGAAVLCLDLIIFILLICWLRGKKIADILLLKIGADSGQGSLKLMLQMLFRDDLIFSGGTLRERRRGGLADNGGLQDSGVARTYIIALIFGASETFESVHYLFDRYDFGGLRFFLHADCEIIFPVDMKMGALMCGIGSSGSLYPMYTSLFSPFLSAESRPLEPRSAVSILRVWEERQAAEKLGATDPKEFQSVCFAPIFALLVLAKDCPLWCFLTPPQLHILLGIVKLFWSWLRLLDFKVASAFMKKHNIVANRKHGHMDFEGNQCRKILRFSRTILDLLPEKHRVPPLSHRQSEGDRDLSGSCSGGEPVSCAPVDSLLYKFFLLRKLVELMLSFSDVVSAVMGSKLESDSWPDILDSFNARRDLFVTLFNKRFPVQSGRDDDRMTMKFECLKHEVPRRILHTGRSLLPDSEQGFEALNHRYMVHELNYKVPRTAQFDGSESAAGSSVSRGLKLSNAARLEGRLPGVSNPSDSTRSGQSRKKRRLAEHSVPKVTAPSFIIGDTQTAQRQRFLSVVAYNRLCLPSGACVQDRVRQWLDWRCTCPRDAPLPFPDKPVRTKCFCVFPLASS